jgi:hypothetical protein
MSGLQVDYNLLRREIGRFANSGRSSSDWDSTQELDIEDCIRRGVRRWYWPEIDQKSGEIYHWSFLQESFEIAIAAGQNTYALPEVFSRMAEDLVCEDGSNRFPLRKANDSMIRRLISTENKQGIPRYYAISSSVAIPSENRSLELTLYPVPSENMTLRGVMDIEPPEISSENPYVLGGAVHAETVLESCLAAAEITFFPELGPGDHRANFEKYLIRSIEYDRKLTEAEGAIYPDDPLETGDNTLGVNKFYLMRLIGNKKGYGPHPGMWSHDQSANVHDILRNGLREFYSPQVIPGERDTHIWSFLAPTYRLTLEAGKYAYDMPPEFVSVQGGIRYAPNTNQVYPQIAVQSIDKVLGILEYSTDSFYAPTCAAFRVKEGDQTTGTRYEMLLAPPPSGGQEILIPFSVNPYQLSVDTSLPMGGQPHAQTLIAACLAAVEADNGAGEQEWQQRFLVRLQASVSLDRQATCPRTVGVSHDDSDYLHSEIYYGNDYWLDNHITSYDMS